MTVGTRMTVRKHTHTTRALLNPETIETNVLIERQYLRLTYTIMLHGQFKIQDETGSKIRMYR
jgi:hypothetical protein